MKAFAQLSAGITKEIKNPLSGILGHIQLAIVKAPSEDVKKHLQIAENEIRRCKGVLESLARVSQTEKLILKPVDLSEVVQNAITLVDHQLSLAQCKVFKDIRPCPLVNGDATQLQSIVVSLLINAAQSVEGSAEKNITIRVLKTGNGHAQIQVEDTGSGISSETAPHIFEPFYTTKAPGKGMGLSLSVSMGVIREHGGDISFQTGESHGTLFTIDLPLPDVALGREPARAPLNVKSLQAPEPFVPAKLAEVRAEAPADGETVVYRPNPLPAMAGASSSLELPSPPPAPFPSAPPSEMPPIPEEVLERGGWAKDDGVFFGSAELTAIIPKDLPVASAALKKDVATHIAEDQTLVIAPDLPGLEKTQTNSKIEMEEKIEMQSSSETDPGFGQDTQVIANGPSTPKVELKTITDFKVKIRRPKLRG